MVKRRRTILLFALTFVLAVSLKNDFFLFLLGFEAMVFVAARIQAVLLARRVSMRVVLPQRMVYREDTFQLRVELTNRSRMPIPQMMVRIAVRRFPEKEELLLRGKLMLDGGETGELCFCVDSTHCACLEIRPDQIVVVDFLGIAQQRCWVDVEDKHLLFVLPVRTGEGAEMPEGQGVLPGGDGESDRRGRAAADVAEIRNYQQGDPIKLIHWKLSARLDDLLVREMNDEAELLLRVYIDLREKDAKKNSRLDAALWDHLMVTVSAVSSLLLERGRKHAVAWADAEGKRLVTFVVTDEENRQEMLCGLLRAETYSGGADLRSLREVAADEAEEADIEIDLQGRVDRSAAA